MLLEQLTAMAFERVRWGFACSAQGVSASNFLALSRATGALGVVGIMFRGSPLWGPQR
jgi:hypothetical protein